MGTVLNIEIAQGADPTDQKVIFGQYAQRAFPKSQDLLSGVVDRTLLRPYALTWHDLGLSLYSGAFAVVSQDATDLVDLIGSVLRVTVRTRSVFVFVVGSGLIDGDISLARRAYLGLAPLNVDPTLASVEVVHEP